eukprot:TRINITY_DN4943_c0_g2_i1.p1 TRINITY_DN4943_c0_g2~~TRINITY_DN4943_c0_g2_i1.p1  ORF type:complete len:113 (-),score=55.00 TRINITY_DN4943_c0_g2_i1:116-454(-)
MTNFKSNSEITQMIETYSQNIYYCDKYEDDFFQYRNVILPKELHVLIKNQQGKLLKEEEWRALGVKGSAGWIHYAVHLPEPHILMFRRSLEVARQQEELQRRQEELAAFQSE